MAELWKEENIGLLLVSSMLLGMGIGLLFSWLALLTMFIGFAGLVFTIANNKKYVESLKNE